MAEKPFLIPSRDDDLLVQNEHQYYVESVSDSVEEFAEAVDAFEQGGFESLPTYFPVFFSMIKNYEIGDRKLRISLFQVLGSNLQMLSTVILDYMTNSGDDLEERKQMLSLQIPMHLYLFCRVFYVLEADYLKWSGSEAALKKNCNKVHQNFVRSFVTDRALAVDQLRDFVCISIKSNGVKTSALKEFFAGDIPVGIPKLVNVLVLKILGDPENNKVRNEPTKLQPALFETLIFMGREWRFLKVIAKEFINKLSEWDYVKKLEKFIYINSIKDLEHASMFLDATVTQYLEDKLQTLDRAKPFGLLIAAVAEHFPDVIFTRFNALYRHIRSDLHMVRGAILSVIKLVLESHIKQRTFEADDEVYIATVQQCLYDGSSHVRTKAAFVLTEVLRTDAEYREIPTGFYGQGVILDIARLLADSWICRKQAAAALDVLLHRNPFGDNMNVDYLHKRYCESVINAEKLKALVDEEELIEELNMEDDMQKESELEGEAQDIVRFVLEEYIENGIFPERNLEPSKEEEVMCYVNASMNFKKSEKKKAAVTELVNYFYQNVIEDRDTVIVEDLVKQLVEILLKFHVGMSDANDDERKNYISEQKRREKEKKYDEEIARQEKLLQAIHYAMHLESCMQFAVDALTRMDKDVELVVHFIAKCRNFKLRGSESAIKQVCKLMYCKNDDVRKFVINSSKEVFFSLNANETISEQSTVQKMLEVMQGSTVEERCALTDTLVAIFKKELLKKGSLNFLWELALGEDRTKAILSMRVLYAHTLAEPKLMQKDFGKIVQVLKKKDDALRIEALRVAVAVGQRQPDEELIEDLKEKVVPPFRLPPTDEYFTLISSQLMTRLTMVDSKRWNIRARLTLKSIFNTCTNPDSMTNMMMSAVLLKAKSLNSNYRVLRRLWLLSVKSLSLLRQKLVEKNCEVAFTISNAEGIRAEIVQLSEGMEKIGVNDTTATQEMYSLTQQEIPDFDGTMNNTGDFCPVFDTRKPEIYDRYHKFTYRKKRAQKKRILEGVKPDEALEFLKVPIDEDGNPEFEALEKEFEVQTLRFHDFKHIQKQCSAFFVLMKNCRKTWQLVMKRLFFLVKEYISRTIFFATDSMTHGIERIKSTLEEVRKLPRGQAKQFQLPMINRTWLLFERDNLEGKSIFESHKGRMEDATGQSTDSVIHSHIREAIGYELFRPGSIVARVYPIACQILRFRRRAPVTAELSDAAMGCLLKMMQASSRVCNYHLGFVFHYMKTAPTKTRANILINLTDIAMCNTYSFSKKIGYFLASIHDKSPSVRLVALLTIHYLNSFKTIMLTDESKAQIAMLLLDTNEHVVNLTKYVFHFMITECNVSVSGLIRDVFLRLYRYEVKEYDFKPVTEFFFEYISSAAEADAATTSICQALIRLARENKNDKYMVSYVVMIVDCLSLIKPNVKQVQKVTLEMDKFRMFFKHLKFCKAMQQYIGYVKKSDTKSETSILAAIDGLENKLQKIREEMRFAAKYDTHADEAVSKATTPAPPSVEMKQNEEEDDVEMTVISDGPFKHPSPIMSPKRRHFDDEVVVKTKRLKQSLLMVPDPVKSADISMNDSSEIPDMSPSSSTTENDENRSRFSRSRCDSSTTDNSLA